MSGSFMEWESLLRTDAPPSYSLKGALFTTYDQPDEQFVAEHLLPTLLRLRRDPGGDGLASQSFRLELDMRIKALRDRLLVVSSFTRGVESAGAPTETANSYGWIWRHIRHARVGKRGPAVQHAKLWMMHWGPTDSGGTEYLEIVVSSANLTRSAFAGQLQAAWRAFLPLSGAKVRGRADASWGVLPEFLREMADSTGESQRFSFFAELLKRCTCPEGSTFVASVPGTYTATALRRAPWGVAALNALIPSGRRRPSLTATVPFVGRWSPSSLASWCEHAGIRTDEFRLVWIDRHHPWRIQWCLPESTRDVLRSTGAAHFHLAFDRSIPAGSDTFHESHRVEDPRWSHSKVYVLDRGSSQTLIVTSANLSTSAWGMPRPRGGLSITNFELGVAVASAESPLTGLSPFEDFDDAVVCKEVPTLPEPLIQWAEARWDGRTVRIMCRLVEHAPVEAMIVSRIARVRVESWHWKAAESSWASTLRWEVANDLPLYAHLNCGDEQIEVAVIDDRPREVLDLLLPSEVDPLAAQHIIDQLLFEKYGGRLAAVGEDGEAFANADELGDASDDPELKDSYAVPALVLARRHLLVVANWARRAAMVAEHGRDSFEMQSMRKDGAALQQALLREAGRSERTGMELGVGARVASEELALRLESIG
jgi:hypothetical protein